MSGWRILGQVADHLARVVRSGIVTDGDDRARHRLDRARFHLARGRRAREAGRFGDGVREAGRALALNPDDAWSLALLGQCLARQSQPHLVTARYALERARSLDPTNGYFVRLLLDVLDAQGDAPARADLLSRAWWQGAPVERWLPDGPPRSRPAREADPDRERAVPPSTPLVHTPAAWSGVARMGRPATTGLRQPVPA